ncbi:hypothetical protein [Beijerinckia indica]|uniref:Uncharacterized protein n=1 Tax=Beijerinckia indica subsp. indica (strain ATCC 9039 / DSM 1715 / NCIMB 8712) TaxID=395963 RepID=B2IER6_BEII9|nr:hypothetical protein [Beijerinckia indica]ACB97006.1 hypothetical protein Bind_3449 [Beijerinckia indica subsp. indica ATCC 9039]
MPPFLFALALAPVLVVTLVPMPRERAQAAQQMLIPVPYPNMLGGQAEIGRPFRQGKHQHLLDDPIPQSLGPNALGNPKAIERTPHQHLLGSPYWRHYRRWH